MPRQLALLLCTAFVLFLLRLERRESGRVSAAVWIPTLWMLAVSCKPLGVWFGTTVTPESGSLPDRLLLAGLGLAGMLVVARRRYDWSRALRRHGWLVALLAYMLVSALWSDIPLIALRRWTREAIVVVMALVLMSEANPREALETLLRRSAYVLVPFSLMLVKYYPALGVEYGRWSGEQMWVGVTLHKNSLGRLCLVSAFFLLWALYRSWRGGLSRDGRSRRWADGSVLFLALFLLRGAESSYSATSVGTLAVGITVLLGLLWLRKHKVPISEPALLGVMVLCIGFGACAPFLDGANIAGLSSSFGRDETLTGRTETWRTLMPAVKDQPVLGSGFGSFWTSARRGQYAMSNAHNGYLDILLELGTLGLVLVIAWLLSCARKLQRSLAAEYEWAALSIGLLVMAAVYNTTESALNGLAEQMTAVLAMASVVVPYEPIRPARRSHQRLRLHLPAEPTVGAAVAQPGPSTNGGPVRVLHRGGGQRPRRVRARGSGESPGGFGRRD